MLELAAAVINRLFVWNFSPFVFEFTTVLGLVNKYSTCTERSGEFYLNFPFGK